MFWEVFGIGTEVILSRVILSLIVPSESLLLICSCYLPTLVYLTLSLVLLSLVSESGS